ncbi:MAG: thioredoxin family protein [Ignavibacteriales bacterium]|nr:thioredoxin family protein [Ignavibacteriales bacterium]
MAVESNMLPLGTKAPDFNLPDTISGKVVSLMEIKSTIATVVMFICNHCPYVIHIQNKLSQVVKEFQVKGISFAAISSNDVIKYPEDSPERMKEVAAKIGFTFPYLYDESQDIARAYKAECTPEFYIFDKDLQLVYRGQFDDSRPSLNIPVTGDSIKNTLEKMIAGAPVDTDQKPSIGCSIKWK